MSPHRKLTSLCLAALTFYWTGSTPGSCSDQITTFDRIGQQRATSKAAAEVDRVDQKQATSKSAATIDRAAAADPFADCVAMTAMSKDAFSACEPSLEFQVTQPPLRAVTHINVLPPIAHAFTDSESAADFGGADVRSMALASRTTFDEAAFSHVLSGMQEEEIDRAALAMQRDIYVEANHQLTELKDIEKSEPDHPDVIARIAKLYLQLDDHTKARYYAMRVLEIDPEFSSVYSTIIEAELKLGLTREAMEHGKEAVKRQPNNYEFLALASLAEIFEMSMVKHLEWAADAIALNPSSLHGKLAEAESRNIHTIRLESISARDSLDSLYRNYLGTQLSCYLGSPSEALRQAQLSTLLHPKSYLAWVDQGHAYRALGKNALAEAAYTKADHLSHHAVPFILIHLAELQAKQGKLLEATDNIEAAKARTPDSQWVNKVSATIHEQTGEPELAGDEYAAAFRLASTRYERLSNLFSAVDCYVRAGTPASATKLLNEGMNYAEGRLEREYIIAESSIRLARMNHSLNENNRCNLAVGRVQKAWKSVFELDTSDSGKLQALNEIRELGLEANSGEQVSITKLRAQALRRNILQRNLHTKLIPARKIAGHQAMDSIFQVGAKFANTNQYGDDFLSACQQEWDGIPLEFKELIKQKGWTVVLVPNIYNDGDANSNLTCTDSRFNCAAYTNPTGNYIVVFQRHFGSGGALTDFCTENGSGLPHEIGHVIDGHLHSYSDSSVFSKRFENDSTSLSWDFKNHFWYYCQSAPNGPCETFAKLFDSRYGHHDDDFVKAFPTLVPLFNRKIEELLTAKAAP